MQSTQAGSNDPSCYTHVQYKPQKVVYHLNHASPLDSIKTLGIIQTHVTALQDQGIGLDSKVAMVIHGNGVHAFSRLNESAFPDIYKRLKSLANAGVEIKLCAQTARARGYHDGQFYEMVTLVPLANLEVVSYQQKGYSYFPPEAFPVKSREDMIKQYPELEF